MIGWLLETLFGVTLLMLLVLAVRRPVAHYFGAGWAYALWLLPALRLVLPPLPSLLPSFSLPSTAAFIPAMDGVTASLPVESGPGQWVPFMLATWAGGAVTFLIWHWLSYRSFLDAVKARSRPGEPPVYGGIETLASEAVEGPLAMGVFERRIVLPWNFERRYSAGERRLAMEHELVHHRRGDIIWNNAGLAILAANWFNPIAWFAFHAFRSDQELACDAAVAKRASAGERHDYARAMVKSASRPGLIAACPLSPADELKHRLRMIRAHRIGRARTAGGATAFAGLLAAGLVFSSAGQPGATEVEAVQIAAPAPRAATVQTASTSAPAAIFERHPVVARARIFRRASTVVVPALASTDSSAQPASVAGPAVAVFHRASADGVAAPRLTVTVGQAHAHAHASAAPDGPSEPRLALAAAPLPGPGLVRLSHAGGARIVAIRVEGGVRILATAGQEPIQIGAVQAALQRAMAQSNDEETRRNLGRAVVALEAKLQELGMITTVN